MDTREFLERILPRQGFKVVAEFVPGRRWPEHTFFTDFGAMAEAILALDAAGRTVYHACAGFTTAENRKQENAGWMRSFWVDIDVAPDHPEKYPDIPTAVRALGAACVALKLPLPLLIKSGRGLHAYWTLTADVRADEWLPVAVALRGALAELGFRQDRTRTADPASVLRPVGSHWRKDGERRVTSLNHGNDIDLEEFRSAVGGAAGDPAAVGPASVPTGIEGASDLSAGIGYPPSSAIRIAEHCATLAHVVSRRGDVEEPLWRAMLGVVKFTTEGDSLGHEWSAGHPQYDPAETQDKLDRWAAGPTTCAHFKVTNGHQCEGCPHTVTSPIQLGYSVDAAPAAPVPPAEPEAPPQPITLPQGFAWNGAQMCFAAKDEQGLVQWLPFCDSLWYPIGRIRAADGTWALKVVHRNRSGKWYEFDLPTKLLGEPQAFVSFLASQEVIVYGKNGSAQSREMVRLYVNSLAGDGVEQLTHDRLGWTDDGRGFVLGNQCVTETRVEPVLCGKPVKHASWDVDFGTAGTLAEWTRLVNLVYARPKAEPYQFIIGCALAAPLVKLVEVENWHGIPAVLTGPSGIGKTTVCKVACSMYGRPSHFLRSALASGSTMTAMVMRVGVARHLPLIFDELTKREQKEVQDLLYMLSNGRDKDRGSADGTLKENKYTWDTVALGTSNDNITELLSQMEARDIAEATQIRVFEIALPHDYNEGIWSDLNVVDVVEHQLLENYGHAGRAWLQYVLANRGALRDEIRELRTQYDQADNVGARERFYRDLIASVLVALKHARKIGLLDFDLRSLALWAKRHTKTLRVRRGAGAFTADDYISMYFGWLQGRTIVTRYFAQPQSAQVEHPLEPLRWTPAARLATVDRRLLVTKAGIAEWAAEARVQMAWFIDELDKRGYLVVHRTGKGKALTFSERLARQTSLPSTPQTVYEIVYDQAMGKLASSESSSQ